MIKSRMYTHKCTFCASVLVITDELMPLKRRWTHPASKIRKRIRAISCPVCYDLIGWMQDPFGFYITKVEMRLIQNKCFSRTPDRTCRVGQK